MDKQSEQVDLAAQLREAIRASGLTRNRLAKLAGVRYSALWRFLEDDSRDSTLSTASKICTVLGMRLTKPKTRSKER